MCFSSPGAIVWDVFAPSALAGVLFQMWLHLQAVREQECFHQVTSTHHVLPFSSRPLAWA